MSEETGRLDWVVCKFGGTSVAKACNWKSSISERAKRIVREGNRCWITVSALSQVTNRLLAAIDESLEKWMIEVEESRMSNYQWIHNTHVKFLNDLGINDIPSDIQNLLDKLKRLLNGIWGTNEASPRIRAEVCSFGELLSSSLGVLALNTYLSDDIKVVRVDSRKLLTSYENDTVAYSDRFLEADVMPRCDVKAAEELCASDAQIVVSQGFIASSHTGDTVLLGRGGSDTSAALFAALLKASRLEIWTDVNGLFTADPRFTPTARLIREVTYREAQEMAGMGAKVLHPRCLGPARWGSIPVQIWNTMDPTPWKDLTTISSKPLQCDDTKILAVTRRKDQTLLSLSSYNMWNTSGFLAKVFAPFETLGISVDLITTSTYSVSLTLDHIPGSVDGDIFKKLLSSLKSLGEVEVVHPVSVVSIVGRKLRTALSKLGDAMSLLEDKKILLVSQSAEDLNLSFVLPQEENNIDDVVTSLHNRLFPEGGEVGKIFGTSWMELKERITQRTE